MQEEQNKYDLSLTAEDIDERLRKAGEAILTIPQELTEAKKAQARENIGINTDPNCHAEYFTITEDGVLSLKPEFRGEPTKTTYLEAISDNGVGVAGSRNAELPEHLVIPEIVGEVAVDSIVEGAFYGNMVFKAITFPRTVKQIPAACFLNSFGLDQVLNTEGVTSVGKKAFQNTSLRNAYFPNLNSLGEAAFCQCSCLTHVNVGKITAIPTDAFFKCRYLSRIESEELITSVGKTALINTNRLVNADFVKNLTSIDNGAFISSGLDYDWSKLQNCTFGTNATALQINPTDFWSACTPTECENPLPTLLCQTDPRWKDREIGDNALDKTYGNGCQFFTIMHIYCGLNNLQLSSVFEFEEIVNGIKQGHLDTYANAWADIKPFAEPLGMKVTEYEYFDQTNLQVLYDSLAAGKYAILGVANGDYSGNMSGHVVVAYGLTKGGKIKLADSDYRYYTDRTKGGVKYNLPYKVACAADPNTSPTFCILEKA